LSPMILCTLLVVSAFFVLATEEEHHWSYPYDVDSWSDGDENAACKSGESQSPINLTESNLIQDTELTLKFQKDGGRIYGATGGKSIGGHALKLLVVDDAEVLMLDGEEYHLLQFHLHTGSEHRVNNKQYAMEAHYVHTIDNEDKGADEVQYAVISLLFELTEDTDHPSVNAINKMLDLFNFQEDQESNWAQEQDYLMGNYTKHFKDEDEFGTDAEIFSAESLIELLQHKDRYWKYSGSLTTPPCTETVTWLVMMEPLAITQAQVSSIVALSGTADNFRPTQPLNGRHVDSGEGTHQGDHGHTDHGDTEHEKILGIGNGVLAIIVIVVFCLISVIAAYKEND